MTDKDNKFKNYVDSLRFDDEPSKDHRGKLEEQLLEAYDQKQYSERVEPVGLYMHKLAMAAGFLIVCGVLFWGVDKMFITKPHPDFIANHPDKEALQEIIRKEQVTGTEKKALVASIRDIWDLIEDEDDESLVSVLQTDEIAMSVRTWAARYLGTFGNEETLTLLDNAILKRSVTDPNDPLKIAATKIRKRLNLPEPETSEKPEVSDTPSMNARDDCEPQAN